MNDGMIVSRLIVGARCDQTYERELLAAAKTTPDGLPAFCVFEVTASRGTKTRRVLCCWSGGALDRNKVKDRTFTKETSGIRFSPVGLAALQALMRLPVCMDDSPALKPLTVIREIKLGPTPLRDKVIDAVLEAQPGARLCFLGDLDGELEGKMSPAFNIMDGDPIMLDDDGRPT
jgi:hypothetical protein